MNKIIILFIILTSEIISQHQNFDFENGLNDWLIDSSKGTAFNSQPTFGSNVISLRVRDTLALKDSIGGDYWREIFHPIGHHGNYWIGTHENSNNSYSRGNIQGNEPTGQLTSSVFTIDSSYLYFLLGGTGGEINLLIEENGIYIQKLSTKVISTRNSNEILSRVEWEIESFKGKPAKLIIIDNSPLTHINVDDFLFSNSKLKLDTEYFRTSYINEKKYYDTLQYLNKRDNDSVSNPPVWGFIDTHGHWMNDLGFGSRLVFGKPYGNIDTALKSCDISHKLDVHINEEEINLGEIIDLGTKGAGKHNKTGYPDFIGWPNFRAVTHQGMHSDWVKRAYLGGIRLIVCVFGNDELLPRITGGIPPYTDSIVIEKQNVQLNEMISYLNKLEEWIEIAYNPEEVKRIIMNNKLAVVKGIEVDEPIKDISDAGIIKNLDHYSNNLGIKYIFPVHIANNPFGGYAIYGSEFFTVNNKYINLPKIEGESLKKTVKRLAKDKSIYADLYEVDSVSFKLYELPFKIKIFNCETDSKQGHINQLGLTLKGKFLCEEIMKRGMIIDIDHMSFMTNNDILKLAISKNYPLIAGHTNFLEQEFTIPEITLGENKIREKLRNEHAKTNYTLEVLKQLGGMVCPTTDGDKDVRTFWESGEILNNNPGSSKTWAQIYLYALNKMGNKNVGLGTDINGFLVQISPRFGTYSAFSLKHDEYRENLLGGRRFLADIQKNGVKYESNLQDTRFHKFNGQGVYDYIDAQILQSIFKAHSNVTNTEGDFETEFSKIITIGFKQGIDSLPLNKFNPIEDGFFPIKGLKTAAYLLAFKHEHKIEPSLLINDKIFRGINKCDLKYYMTMLDTIYTIWDNLNGNNNPLKRYFIKTEKGIRDFDFNIDGLAHYGMLPDLFQDLKNIGLSGVYLSPIFNSANDFMRMWQKCEERSNYIK